MDNQRHSRLVGFPTIVAATDNTSLQIQPSHSIPLVSSHLSANNADAFPSLSGNITSGTPSSVPLSAQSLPLHSFSSSSFPLTSASSSCLSFADTRQNVANPPPGLTSSLPYHHPALHPSSSDQPRPYPSQAPTATGLPFQAAVSSSVPLGDPRSPPSLSLVTTAPHRTQHATPTPHSNTAIQPVTAGAHTHARVQPVRLPLAWGHAGDLPLQHAPSRSTHIHSTAQPSPLSASYTSSLTSAPVSAAYHSPRAVVPIHSTATTTHTQPQLHYQHHNHQQQQQQQQLQGQPHRYYQPQHQQLHRSAHAHSTVTTHTNVGVNGNGSRNAGTSTSMTVGVGVDGSAIMSPITPRVLPFSVASPTPENTHVQNPEMRFSQSPSTRISGPISIQTQPPTIENPPSSEKINLDKPTVSVKRTNSGKNVRSRAALPPSLSPAPRTPNARIFVPSSSSGSPSSRTTSTSTSTTATATATTSASAHVSARPHAIPHTSSSRRTHTLAPHAHAATQSAQRSAPNTAPHQVPATRRLTHTTSHTHTDIHSHDPAHPHTRTHPHGHAHTQTHKQLRAREQAWDEGIISPEQSLLQRENPIVPETNPENISFRIPNSGVGIAPSSPARRHRVCPSPPRRNSIPENSSPNSARKIPDSQTTQVLGFVENSRKQSISGVLTESESPPLATTTTATSSSTSVTPQRRNIPNNSSRNSDKVPKMDVHGRFVDVKSGIVQTLQAMPMEYVNQQVLAVVTSLSSGKTTPGKNNSGKPSIRSVESGKKPVASGKMSYPYDPLTKSGLPILATIVQPQFPSLPEKATVNDGMIPDTGSSHRYFADDGASPGKTTEEARKEHVAEHKVDENNQVEHPRQQQQQQQQQYNADVEQDWEEEDEEAEQQHREQEGTGGGEDDVVVGADKRDTRMNLDDDIPNIPSSSSFTTTNASLPLPSSLSLTTSASVLRTSPISLDRVATWALEAVAGNTDDGYGGQHGRAGEEEEEEEENIMQDAIDAVNGAIANADDGNVRDGRRGGASARATPSKPLPPSILLAPSAVSNPHTDTRGRKRVSDEEESDGKKIFRKNYRPRPVSGPVYLQNYPVIIYPAHGRFQREKMTLDLSLYDVPEGFFYKDGKIHCINSEGKQIIVQNGSELVEQIDWENPGKYFSEDVIVVGRNVGNGKNLGRELSTPISLSRRPSSVRVVRDANDTGMGLPYSSTGAYSGSNGYSSRSQSRGGRDSHYSHYHGGNGEGDGVMMDISMSKEREPYIIDMDPSSSAGKQKKTQKRHHPEVERVESAEVAHIPMAKIGNLRTPEKDKFRDNAQNSHLNRHGSLPNLQIGSDYQTSEYSLRSGKQVFPAYTPRPYSDVDREEDGRSENSGEHFSQYVDSQTNNGSMRDYSDNQSAGSGDGDSGYRSASASVYGSDASYRENDDNTSHYTASQGTLASDRSRSQAASTQHSDGAQNTTNSPSPFSPQSVLSGKSMLSGKSQNSGVSSISTAIPLEVQVLELDESKDTFIGIQLHQNRAATEAPVSRLPSMVGKTDTDSYIPVHFSGNLDNTHSGAGTFRMSSELTESGFSMVPGGQHYLNHSVHHHHNRTYSYAGSNGSATSNGAGADAGAGTSMGMGDSFGNGDSFSANNYEAYMQEQQRNMASNRTSFPNGPESGNDNFPGNPGNPGNAPVEVGKNGRYGYGFAMDNTSNINRLRADIGANLAVAPRHHPENAHPGNFMNRLSGNGNFPHGDDDWQPYDTIGMTMGGAVRVDGLSHSMRSVGSHSGYGYGFGYEGSAGTGVAIERDIEVASVWDEVDCVEVEVVEVDVPGMGDGGEVREEAEGDGTANAGSNANAHGDGGSGSTMNTNNTGAGASSASGNGSGNAGAERSQSREWSQQRHQLQDVCEVNGSVVTIYGQIVQYPDLEEEEDGIGNEGEKNKETAEGKDKDEKEKEGKRRKDVVSEKMKENQEIVFSRQYIMNIDITTALLTQLTEEYIWVPNGKKKKLELSPQSSGKEADGTGKDGDSAKSGTNTSSSQNEQDSSEKEKSEGGEEKSYKKIRRVRTRRRRVGEMLRIPVLAFIRKYVSREFRKDISIEVMQHLPLPPEKRASENFRRNSFSRQLCAVPEGLEPSTSADDVMGINGSNDRETSDINHGLRGKRHFFKDEGDGGEEGEELSSEKYGNRYPRVIIPSDTPIFRSGKIRNPESHFSENEGFPMLGAYAQRHTRQRYELGFLTPLNDSRMRVHANGSEMTEAGDEEEGGEDVDGYGYDMGGRRARGREEDGEGYFRTRNSQSESRNSRDTSEWARSHSESRNSRNYEISGNSRSHSFSENSADFSQNQSARGKGSQEDPHGQDYRRGSNDNCDKHDGNLDSNTENTHHLKRRSFSTTLPTPNTCHTHSNSSNDGGNGRVGDDAGLVHSLSYSTYSHTQHSPHTHDIHAPNTGADASHGADQATNGDTSKLPKHTSFPSSTSPTSPFDSASPAHMLSQTHLNVYRDTVLTAAASTGAPSPLFSFSPFAPTPCPSPPAFASSLSPLALPRQGQPGSTLTRTLAPSPLYPHSTTFSINTGVNNLNNGADDGNGSGHGSGMVPIYGRTYATPPMATYYTLPSGHVVLRLAALTGNSTQTRTGRNNGCRMFLPPMLLSEIPSPPEKICPSPLSDAYLHLKSILDYTVAACTPAPSSGKYKSGNYIYNPYFFPNAVSHSQPSRVSRKEVCGGVCIGAEYNVDSAAMRQAQVMLSEGSYSRDGVRDGVHGDEHNTNTETFSSFLHPINTPPLNIPLLSSSLHYRAYGDNGVCGDTHAVALSPLQHMHIPGIRLWKHNVRGGVRDASLILLSQRLCWVGCDEIDDCDGEAIGAVYDHCIYDGKSHSIVNNDKNSLNGVNTSDWHRRNGAHKHGISIAQALGMSGTCIFRKPKIIPEGTFIFRDLFRKKQVKTSVSEFIALHSEHSGTTNIPTIYHPSSTSVSATSTSTSGSAALVSIPPSLHALTSGYTNIRGTITPICTHLPKHSSFLSWDAIVRIITPENVNSLRDSPKFRNLASKIPENSEFLVFLSTVGKNESYVCDPSVRYHDDLSVHAAEYALALQIDVDTRQFSSNTNILTPDIDVHIHTQTQMQAHGQGQGQMPNRAHSSRASNATAAAGTSLSAGVGVFTSVNVGNTSTGTSTSTSTSTTRLYNYDSSNAHLYLSRRPNAKYTVHTHTMRTGTSADTSTSMGMGLSGSATGADGGVSYCYDYNYNCLDIPQPYVFAPVLKLLGISHVSGVPMNRRNSGISQNSGNPANSTNSRKNPEAATCTCHFPDTCVCSFTCAHDMHISRYHSLLQPYKYGPHYLNNTQYLTSSSKSGAGSSGSGHGAGVGGAGNRHPHMVVAVPTGVHTLRGDTSLRNNSQSLGNTAQSLRSNGVSLPSVGAFVAGYNNTGDAYEGNTRNDAGTTTGMGASAADVEGVNVECHRSQLTHICAQPQAYGLGNNGSTIGNGDVDSKITVVIPENDALCAYCCGYKDLRNHAQPPLSQLSTQLSKLSSQSSKSSSPVVTSPLSSQSSKLSSSPATAIRHVLSQGLSILKLLHKTALAISKGSCHVHNFTRGLLLPVSRYGYLREYSLSYDPVASLRSGTLRATTPAATGATAGTTAGVGPVSAVTTTTTHPHSSFTLVASPTPASRPPSSLASLAPAAWSEVERDRLLLVALREVQTVTMREMQERRKDLLGRFYEEWGDEKRADINVTLNPNRTGTGADCDEDEERQRQTEVSRVAAMVNTLTKPCTCGQWGMSYPPYAHAHVLAHSQALGHAGEHAQVLPLPHAHATHTQPHTHAQMQRQESLQTRNSGNGNGAGVSGMLPPSLPAPHVAFPAAHHTHHAHPAHPSPSSPFHPRPHLQQQSPTQSPAQTRARAASSAAALPYSAHPYTHTSHSSNINTRADSQSCSGENSHTHNNTHSTSAPLSSPQRQHQQQHHPHHMGPGNTIIAAAVIGEAGGVAGDMSAGGAIDMGSGKISPVSTHTLIPANTHAHAHPSSSVPRDTHNLPARVATVSPAACTTSHGVATDCGIGATADGGAIGGARVSIPSADEADTTPSSTARRLYTHLSSHAHAQPQTRAPGRDGHGVQRNAKADTEVEVVDKRSSRDSDGGDGRVQGRNDTRSALTVDVGSHSHKQHDGVRNGDYPRNDDNDLRNSDSNVVADDDYYANSLFAHKASSLASEGTKYMLPSPDAHQIYGSPYRKHKLDGVTFRKTTDTIASGILMNSGHNGRNNGNGTRGVDINGGSDCGVETTHTNANKHATNTKTNTSSRTNAGSAAGSGSGGGSVHPSSSSSSRSVRDVRQPRDTRDTRGIRDRRDGASGRGRGGDGETRSSNNPRVSTSRNTGSGENDITQSTRRSSLSTAAAGASLSAEGRPTNGKGVGKSTTIGADGDVSGRRNDGGGNVGMNKSRSIANAGEGAGSVAGRRDSGVASISRSQVSKRTSTNTANAANAASISYSASTSTSVSASTRKRGERGQRREAREEVVEDSDGDGDDVAHHTYSQDHEYSDDGDDQDDDPDNHNGNRDGQADNFYDDRDVGNEHSFSSSEEEEEEWIRALSPRSVRTAHDLPTTHNRSSGIGKGSGTASLPKHTAPRASTTTHLTSRSSFFPPPGHTEAREHGSLKKMAQAQKNLSGNGAGAGARGGGSERNTAAHASHTVGNIPVSTSSHASAAGHANAGVSAGLGVGSNRHRDTSAGLQTLTELNTLANTHANVNTHANTVVSGNHHGSAGDGVVSMRDSVKKSRVSVLYEASDESLDEEEEFEKSGSMVIPKSPIGNFPKSASTGKSGNMLSSGNTTSPGKLANSGSFSSSGKRVLISPTVTRSSIPPVGAETDAGTDFPYVGTKPRKNSTSGNSSAGISAPTSKSQSSVSKSGSNISDIVVALAAQKKSSKLPAGAVRAYI